MIDTHTLARNVIERHNTPNDVFDDENLALLKRFCDDPSKKDEILRGKDMIDEPGTAPGTKANFVHGSLVGYCIARHGTDDPVLSDGEIVMLRDWFATIS